MTETGARQGEVPPDDGGFRYRLWIGAAVWGLVCVAGVCLRGVHWDETYEYAQVITGQVPYPDAHPMRVYARNAFSVQTWGAAALLAAGAGPLLLCGLRNVLFLLATVLPPYLLGALATRRTRWGFVAAALVLECVFLEFDGSYPLFVWPELYSNGHIGGAVALVALALLLANQVRTAALLFGLMPAIHLGQWPPLLAVFACYALWLLLRRDWTPLRRLAAWGVAGLALTAALYALHHPFKVPLAGAGPYASGPEAQALWRDFTAFHDPHRRFPPANGQILLAGTLLLSVLAAWRADNETARKRFGWLACYAGIIAAITWGTMALHAVLGERMPFLFIAWMPYRLFNHLGPVAAAVMLGALCGGARKDSGTPDPARRHGGQVLVLLLLAWGFAHVFLRDVIPQPWYGRYIANNEGVAFVLFGASLAALFRGPRTGRPHHVGTLAVVLAAAAVLALFHQFGAACLLAGAVAYPLLQWLPAVGRHKRCGFAFALACVAIALACAALQPHQTLPRTPFELRVASVLRQRNREDAMLAVPPDSYTAQARTGHPVLAEAVTPSLISYMPGLAPAINRLWRGLYGVPLEQPPPGAPPPASWETVWRQRPAEDWRALARRYEFDYVVAPERVPLRLPLVLEDGGMALYEMRPE